MKVLIWVTLALCILRCIAHNHYNCVFDRTNRDLHDISLASKPDIGIPPSSQRLSQSRNLLSITRNSIRITLDSSMFTSLNPGLNGAANTTTQNLAFILRTMRVGVNFLMTRLKVYPLTSVLAPVSCVDFTPPANDQNFGIVGSDLHIYVRYTTDSSQAYGATGKSCKYYGDQVASLPDYTLQVGRPTVGRIIFNTYKLTDQQVALTNRLFQSITSTALHESMHILGMDSTLYYSWLDSDEASATYAKNYTATTLDGTGIMHSSRTNTRFMITPHVASWAQNYYNCPAINLPGIPLENEDGSFGLGGGGSHWERVAVYDELMTGTAMGAAKGFSGLTFAALKDMGWYSVDDTFNETSNYGYKKGCTFVKDACYGTSFSEFCDISTQASISNCQSTFFGKAICSTTSGLMADGCGLYGSYFNCVDPDSRSEGYQTYTLEVYGTTSFCIKSTLGSVSLPSTVLSRCYPYVCTATNVTFTIGTYTIVCQSNEAGVQKTLSAFTGYLQCPVFADFCTNSRKTCPNWCSQNGYCMGGICNCYSGYYGDDCSQNHCTSDTYYNPLTGLCVTTCPSGYYQNVYSETCEKCDSSCGQCFGEPTICTGCISTVADPQYFYNGTCYSICPDGTYSSGFTCLICDSSIDCATCFGSATNCTSCLNFKYLNQPIYGACIAGCPISGTYTVADVINFQCVSTCANNLILINNTCTFCQSPNGYKLVSNSSCVPTCPDFYYADDTKHLCSRCDSSCLTCTGPYAQNCESCSPTATLRYLLLQMCWSVCPGGYYAETNRSACILCPTYLNCGNCTIDNTTAIVQCTSCAYGYFFQTNSSSCVFSCEANQFSNKGNNTCINCDASCATCEGPGSSYCTSCPNTTLYTTNVTGGYCISNCSASQTRSGSNCLPCDQTCLTCVGTSSNQCASCSNGTFLSSTNYCRYVCPAATYPNTLLNKCSPCDGSCTNCFGSTINNCTACINGMFLFNFTCTIKCPSGYTVNQWNVCSEGALKLAALVLLLLLGLIY